MPPPAPPKPKAAPLPDYKTLAAQFAAAKRAKEVEDADRAREDIHEEQNRASVAERRREALEAQRKAAYERRWLWAVAFWLWVLCVHAVGIAYFTSGFLLTRLVLDERSSCAVTPLDGNGKGGNIVPQWQGRGTVDGGCWHPKTFDRAVVILIDALRYDFTVPRGSETAKQAFHDAFPFLYETAVRSPNRAFLRPFIADPPTTTLQRLKGLTTGTLPTFIDAGSNFAGTAIEEDNLLMQLRDAGKKIVHLGDDTWHSLFPGYFEPELSKAYDSFNVWDLHTVDNGVLEHIFPVINRTADWDLLIGHFLGVDHAGHRYGPDHPEMAKKLNQMDVFVRNITTLIDDDTLLVVIGDHGMDSKGDHGGESDDEIEAALWMYSSRPIFGRTSLDFVAPPPNAKVHPTSQIDLVPTLALLLGIPIPYNNLGRPIEEAFAGRHGDAWDNLAAVTRMTSAGIKRYQASYFAARGIEQDVSPGSPEDLWNQAEARVAVDTARKSWLDAYGAFARYQEETLRICRSLWARFDVSNMILGIVIMAFGVFVLLLYTSRDEDEDIAVLDDPEFDLTERSLELQGVDADSSAGSYQTLHKNLVRAAVLGAVPAFGVGVLQSFITGAGDWWRGSGFAALTSMATVTVALFSEGKSLAGLLPNTVWGWLSVVFTVSQSVGFASNSYTIWEDSILLFFLTTFGCVAALQALQLPSRADRYLAIYHAVVFVLLGRLASFSKLCREEQMPYCTSTYYASATSSTAAPWQLVIPFAVFLILPSILKAFLTPTRSYEGLAPTWIGYVFRTTLFMSAMFWVLDAADNGNWLPGPAGESLKTTRVYIAQLVLGLAFVAGTTAFVWAPPCVSITTVTVPSSGRAQVTVLGYANALGARYLLLPVNILAACVLLSKPVGGGALAIMMWQVLCIAELVDLLSLPIASEAAAPVVLALLGNFHFFKTGHQATLSSIQWDSAFVPLFTIRYPWSPLVVALNTFAGQVLAASAVPLFVLWKAGPRRRGVLERVGRALGAFVAFFAVEALATMAWAGWLRRHLMLYRVFSPRFMTAAALLLVVDVIAIVVALAGVRSNTLAVSEVFGWVE